ncbi:hypothetical protein JCM8097_008628 [Rhodosporidiobolus ruineniae]
MYGRGPPPGYGAPPPTGPRGGHGGGYGGGANAIPTGPRGHHTGLGASPSGPSSLPHRPPGLPQTPSFSTPPPVGFVPASGGMGGDGSPGFYQGEKFSLFVGSIVDGVENGWLERILGVAGLVLSFRRPTPAFAFVEYADPESVLRCLEVVNGANIKTKQGAEKVLLVKADEKTRARLDEYEKGRVASETNSDLTQQAKDDLEAILRRIAAGDPATAALLPADASPSDDASGATRGPKIPNHLKDLAPEDLPENHRQNTLSEISKFRERAVKKAVDRHELNLQAEERRRQVEAQNRARQLQEQQQRRASTAGAGPDGLPANGGPAAAETPVGELDDIRRERERAERESRQQEAVFRDRERRFEARERVRIQAWEREMARERNVAEQEERDRAFMAERLATWDDDREAERGRESFYIDRVRWRAQRKPLRAREAEADARDRAVEAQHLAAIEQQSDSFLSQHADLFAGAPTQPAPSAPSAPVEASPATGAEASPARPAADSSAPPSTEPNGTAATASPAPPAAPTAVKLSISAASKASSSEPAKGKGRPTAMALEDEEEEGRRKRTLIPLTYDDDEVKKEEAKPLVVEQEKPGPSREETHRRGTEVEARVPKDKDGLWAWKVRWEVLSEDLVKQMVLPFANALIVKYLGSEEPELVAVVEEYLRDRKSPQELLDELELVLDEDATDFVVKVWRQLAVQTELRHAGIDA